MNFKIRSLSIQFVLVFCFVFAGCNSSGDDSKNNGRIMTVPSSQQKKASTKSVEYDFPGLSSVPDWTITTCQNVRDWPGASEKAVLTINKLTPQKMISVPGNGVLAFTSFGQNFSSVPGQPCYDRTAHNESFSHIYAVRFLPDGRRDSQFGTDGISTLQITEQDVKDSGIPIAKEHSSYVLDALPIGSQQTLAIIAVGQTLSDHKDRVLNHNMLSIIRSDGSWDKSSFLKKGISQQCDETKLIPGENTHVIYFQCTHYHTPGLQDGVVTETSREWWRVDASNSKTSVSREVALPNDYYSKIRFLSDGSYLRMRIVSGVGSEVIQSFWLERYTADHLRDPSFCKHPVSATPQGVCKITAYTNSDRSYQDTFDQVPSIELTSGGKIMVLNQHAGGLGIYRLNASGDLDQSFGDHGFFKFRPGWRWQIRSHFYAEDDSIFLISGNDLNELISIQHVTFTPGTRVEDVPLPKDWNTYGPGYSYNICSPDAAAAEGGGVYLPISYLHKPKAASNNGKSYENEYFFGILKLKANGEVNTDFYRH